LVGSTSDSAAVNICAMNFLQLWGRNMIRLPCFSHICHRIGSNLADSPEEGVCSFALFSVLFYFSNQFFKSIFFLSIIDNF
jgi:hypothetical protein